MTETSAPSVHGKPKRKYHDTKEFMLHAIREVVGINEINTRGYSVPSRVHVEGIEGHFERWIGIDWWVKDGEKIEDSIRHQKQPLAKVNEQIRLFNQERLDRMVQMEREGIVAFTMSHSSEKSDPDTPDQPRIVPPDEILRRFLYKNRRTLLDKLWQLANGIEISKPDRKGEMRTYTQPPDRDVLIFLASQFFGKPKTKEKSMSEVADEKSKNTGVIVKDAM